MSIFILIGVAGLLAIGLFLLLIFGSSTTGIHKEDRVIKHFEQNRAALEQVVEEALDADIAYAKRSSWHASQRPEGKAHRSLLNSMRRAKVLEVWARSEDSSEVTLIVGTKLHVIDTEFFGYLWTLNPENVVEGLGATEGKYLRLSPNWFLYRFEQS